MYRVPLGVMLGLACLSMAHAQFLGLAGHANDASGLALAIHEVLAVCGSDDPGEPCPFPLGYVSHAYTLPDVAALLFAAAKFIILLAVA